MREVSLVSVKVAVVRFFKWVQTAVSTPMTWATFVLLPVSLFFSAYHLFWVFDFPRVFAGLMMLVVCVYVNKSL